MSHFDILSNTYQYRFQSSDSTKGYPSRNVISKSDVHVPFVPNLLYSLFSGTTYDYSSGAIPLSRQMIHNALSYIQSPTDAELGKKIDYAVLLGPASSFPNIMLRIKYTKDGLVATWISREKQADDQPPIDTTLCSLTLSAEDTTLHPLMTEIADQLELYVRNFFSFIKEKLQDYAHIKENPMYDIIALIYVLRVLVGTTPPALFIIRLLAMRRETHIETVVDALMRSAPMHVNVLTRYQDLGTDLVHTVMRKRENEVDGEKVTSVVEFFSMKLVGLTGCAFTTNISLVGRPPRTTRLVGVKTDGEMNFN